MRSRREGTRVFYRLASERVGELWAAVRDCVYADDAVRLLRGRGLRARRLDVGYPEWRRAGLPVEVTS